MNKEILLSNIDRVHTTEIGIYRIRCVEIFDFDEQLSYKNVR